MKPGQQGPHHPDLYELLRSEVMHGAVIRFSLVGITYVVGKGWRDIHGPLEADIAHSRLRRWWQWDRRRELTRKTRERRRTH